MNFSEKRVKLLEDSRKALNLGIYVQREGRPPYGHGKVCVTSTPSGKGKSWINDVMGEIDNVNEFISIPSGKSLSQNNFKPAYSYQLPPVKFTDHLSDCFGWAKCW